MIAFSDTRAYLEDPVAVNAALRANTQRVVPLPRMRQARGLWWCWSHVAGPMYRIGSGDTQAAAFRQWRVIGAGARDFAAPT